VPFQKALWGKSEKDNEAKAKGCKITYLDAKSLAEFERAVQPIYDEFKDYAGLIAQIKAVK
jgi:TRAP-type C4-dicarboxylate transport system substrate-binding protein